MKTIFLGELRLNLKALFIWSIVIGSFGFICILLYESMQGDMREMADAFSSMGAFSDAFGMSTLSIATLKGYFAAEIGTDKCEIELAYAIGVAKPVSIMVDTFGTGKVSDEKLAEAVDKVFDLKPAAIIRDLELRKPQYRKLAAYGHMGREDLGVAWEKTDRTEALLAAVK